MAFVTWLNRHYEERGPLKWLAFLLELLAAVALFLLMCLTCIDVVGRYFFSRPLIGATELTEIGLSFVIFAAMPVITWRGGHIVVDLIDSYVPSVCLSCWLGFRPFLLPPLFILLRCVYLPLVRVICAALLSPISFLSPRAMSYKALLY